MRVSPVNTKSFNNSTKTFNIKQSSGISTSPNNDKNINNLSQLPYYYPVSFTSKADNLALQSFSKLKLLFHYDLPCIYSGVIMIDPKEYSALLKNGILNRSSKESVEVLKKYKSRLTGMEERITNLLIARSKIHPNKNIHDILQEIEPVYRRDLRKKQSKIFYNLQEEFKTLPKSYQEKFKIMMSETNKRLGEHPVLLPFSSYEFKYKLIKIKKDLLLTNKNLKTKKILNKLIKESKKLNNSTNSDTLENQIKVVGMMDWILKKSILKDNVELINLIKISKSRLTNKEIVAPFSRKSFLYDLGRIVDNLPEEKRNKIMTEACKLPTSFQDFSAYIVKTASESSDRIVFRILNPYFASVEHIIPRSIGGENVISNFAGATRRENSRRKSIDFTEQMKLRPKTPYYCQLYVNRLIELYHQGIFKKHGINPKYIEEFRNTIYKVSKGQINLDISKFYD